MKIRRRRLVVAAVAVLGLALVPAAFGSAEASAPPPLPHTDQATPPAPGQAPAAPAPADPAPAAVPDLPIQASDIALSFPGQPGTGVVLTDQARERRAIAAAGGAAAWAKQVAKADAALAKMPKGLLPHVDSAPSGHRPYGGDMWSGGSVAKNIAACTWGLSSRSADGRQFGYTAGHCVMNEAGTAPDIDPNTGVFCVGFVNPCPSIDIGNTGHGGTCFGSCGDKTFIRANKAWLGNGLRSEARTWDSRTTVAIPSVGNPVYAEAASVSGGKSGRLIHGTVIVTKQPQEFVGGAVVQVAVMKAASGDCPIPGDSGGPIIAGDHSVIGTLTGNINASDGCYIYFGRAGDAFVSVNQVPAPLP
jgi:hypothetical protein